MKQRNRILLFLIILAVIDMVIPIPFTTILLIYVLVEKPFWFRELVEEVYHSA